MSEKAGNLRQIFILAGATPMTNATGAKVNGVDDSTIQELCNLLDKTQYGDTYHKRMAGLLDTSVSISGNYDTADTNGQNVIVAGAEVMVGVYPDGTGVAGLQYPCFIESREYSAGVDGKQAFSASFKGNGAPVALPLRP